MAALCFSSQHRMNIGILLIEQLFKNIKLVGTSTDNGKKTAKAILSSVTSLK